MRLASDIAITHGNLAVRLRPSLRAALRIHRMGDFRNVLAQVLEGSVDTITAVIEIVADDKILARKIFDLKLNQHVGRAIASLQHALIPVLSTSFGLDETSSDKPPRATAEVDFERSLTDLFEIGTGWLGWAPTETWAATPAEIIVAHRGLVAKLKAIHGGAEDQTATSYDRTADASDEEIRDGIAKLKSLSGRA